MKGLTPIERVRAMTRQSLGGVAAADAQLSTAGAGTTTATAGHGSSRKQTAAAGVSSSRSSGAAWERPEMAQSAAFFSK
jgi:hypothetical protein